MRPAVLLLALAALVPGCGEPARPDPCADLSADDLQPSPDGRTLVAMSTSMGCMGAELYDGRAPLTVGNFLTYVREGFYTDVQFHAIVRNFTIHTGSVRWDGAEVTPTHPPIRNEAREANLHHAQYAMAMARSPDPDFHSARAEFFIDVLENWGLDPGSSSEYGYAVFGRVIHGTHIVDQINALSGTDPPPLLYSIRILSTPGTTATPTPPTP